MTARLFSRWSYQTPAFNTRIYLPGATRTPFLFYFIYIYIHAYTHTHERFFCRLLDFFFVNLFLYLVAYFLYSFFFLLTSSDFLIHPIRRFLYSSLWSFPIFYFPFYCATWSMRWWRRNWPRTIALLLNIELLYFAGDLNTAPLLPHPAQRTPYLTDRFISHK